MSGPVSPAKIRNRSLAMQMQRDSSTHSDEALRARILEMVERSRALSYQSMAEGLALSEEAFRLSVEANDHELIAYSLQSRAWARFAQRNYGAAHTDACESLRHAMISENERVLTFSHLMLGVVAYQNGDLTDAEDAFETVLRLAQNRQDEELEAKAMANLACVCYRLKHSDSAIDYGLRAIQALERTPVIYQENLLRSNLVEHYLQSADAHAEKQNAYAQKHAVDLAADQLAILFGRESFRATPGLLALAEANAMRIGLHRKSLGHVRFHLKRLREHVLAGGNPYERGILSGAEGNYAFYKRQFAKAGKLFAEAAEHFGPIGESYFENFAHEMAYKSFVKARRFGDALRHADWILSSREIHAAGSCQRRSQLLKIKLDVERTLQEKILLETKNLVLQNRTNELERQANTDGLTQVLNRRGFEKAIRAKEAETFKCVGMIDIDHFKSINDRFGHAVGDEVLRIVARIFADELRESDLLARLGGEEFALVLSIASIDTACRACERLRWCVEKYPWHFIAEDLSVTVSIGLQQWPFGVPSGEAMHRADLALYDAKRQGRNCVSTTLIEDRRAA